MAASIMHRYNMANFLVLGSRAGGNGVIKNNLQYWAGNWFGAVQQFSRYVVGARGTWDLKISKSASHSAVIVIGDICVNMSSGKEGTPWLSLWVKIEQKY